ncbi:MAG: hypothetical protein ACOCX2_06355 [Armatimonadota bacterium]
MTTRITVLIALLATGITFAQDGFVPKQFHLTVPIVQDGEAVASIVADEGQADLAEAVRRVVREASGVELPVVAPADAGEEAWVEGRSFIVLGRLGANPIVDALYINHYALSDEEYPGEGGHEFRTVHDPWGSGGSAVFLGGSDDAGVRRAIDRFAEALPEAQEVAIPHTVDVAGANVSQPLAEVDVERLREQLAGQNFRAVGNRASAGCLKYHRSGDRNQAIVAREALYRLAEIVAEMPVVGDSRGVVYLPTIFDLTEESDAWSDADRTELSRFLHEFSTKLRYLQDPIEPSPIPHGNNWNIRTAWSATRYFDKYYDINLNDVALENLATYFGNQMTWKSREDCPGYGSITVIDILHYVLKKPNFEAYFESGLAREMADYAMTVTDNRGSLAGFGDYSALNGSAHFPDPMRVLAWYYDDGRYAWIEQKMLGDATGGEYLGQAFAMDLEPREPTDLLGVHVLPLEDWIYENRDRALGTGVPSTDAHLRASEDPPHEQCFDKISLRDSFDADSEYLLLGGQSHGYHSHPDGNSIISFTDNDRLWLFDNGYFVPDTVEHNTMMIVRDGLFEPVPRLAWLDLTADLPDTGMTRTTLRGYNGADWSRTIIWAKGEYMLALDEVTAREAGDFGLQCIWRVLGEPQVDGDRTLVTQTGKRFSLVTDGAPTWEQRPVTPEYAGRHALLQNQNATLAEGESLSFVNAFYCPDGEEDFPVEVVRVADGAVLVDTPEGVAYAGAGPLSVEGLPEVNAALFHITPTRTTLAGATQFDGVSFTSEAPVDVELDFAAGTGVIECEEPLTARVAGEGETRLEAGRHELSFAADEAAADADPFRAMYESLAAQKAEVLAQREGGAEAAGEALFAHEATREVTRTFFVDADGDEIANLAQQGAAQAWTEAQQGAGPRNAVDGNLGTYSAVKSSAPHTSDLPKDLGVEWDQPVTVSQAWFHHYNADYAPAEDGHDIQAWDGEDWVSVDDTVEKRDDGATWVHTFEPVETTRLRLFVTAFSGHRTAIREMRMFERPASETDETLMLPKPPRAMTTADLTGDGRAEIIACMADELLAIDGSGEALWSVSLGDRHWLSVDVFDLDADGRPEVIAGGADHRVHCFDAAGNERWVADCPADPFQPEREPETGTIDVLAAGDINADGLGEVVFGASNWFAYALSHEGELLWTALNWAHPPLDITLHDVTGDGNLEALIATKYNDANLFNAEGERVDRVSAGYHGIPMSVATGDLQGDGTVEMVAGSRVGNVHVKTHEGAAWELSMGSQVTDVAVAELGIGGPRQVVACSASHYVLCADADGNVLWRANVGGAARQMAVGDLTGDGAPEIVVAVADAPPAVLSASGEILARIGPPDAEQVALADVDGDGQAEVVCAAEGVVGAWR